MLITVNKIINNHKNDFLVAQLQMSKFWYFAIAPCITFIKFNINDDITLKNIFYVKMWNINTDIQIGNGIDMYFLSGAVGG